MRKTSLNLDALTAFRGVAAWWVVLYHIKDYISIPGVDDIISLGYLAVDFFFVLSGFIISYAYYTNLTYFSKSNILKFYLKRLSRIYPLHFLVLCIYCILPILYYLSDKSLPTEGKYSLEYLILSFGLIQNWGLMSGLAWNVPAWSISTEFFVYITFPCLVFLLSKIKSKIGVIALLFFALCAIPTIFISEGTLNIGDSITTLGLYRCAFEFLIGACCYRLFTMNLALSPKLTILLFPSGILLFILPSILIDKSMSLFFVPLSSALIIYSTLFLPQKIIQFSLYKNVQYLGEMSYSTYMLHYIILDIFKLVTPNYENINILWISLYIGTLLIASSLSFRFIEHNSRRWLNTKIDKAFNQGLTTSPNSFNK